MRSNRHAFTLLDLVACIGLAAVVSAVGVPAVRTAASDNSLQRCRYNFRGLAQGSAMYAEDFAGRMWALSARMGTKDPVNPNFTYGTDLEAQSFQATYALRKILNLTPVNSPVPTNWAPMLLYSHVALLDYLGARLPSTAFTCPLDTFREPWTRGDFRNLTNPSEEGVIYPWRTPASMSYLASVYQWMPSRQVSFIENGQVRYSPTAWPVSSDVRQWSFDSGFTTSSAGWFGPKLVGDVRYPAQKVAMFDEFARHNGAQRYFAYGSAAQDLLFYDSSVRTYRTDATNPGWDPSSASNRGRMTRRFAFTRFADLTGGLDNNKASDTFAAGWYRWTRGGLLGWDVPRLSSMVGKPPSANVVENELNTSVGTW